MAYSNLLEVWDDPETAGIFTSLQKLSVPWQSENVAQVLDVDYFYNHSGQKIISPLVRSQLNDDSKITSTESDKLASILYAICGTSWQKEYTALTVEYSPIENVDGYLTETTDRTGNVKSSNTLTDTGTDTHTKTGTDTDTRTGTDSHTLSGTDTIKDSGTDTHALTGTDTTKNTGTQKNENVNEDGTSTTENQIYGYNSSDPANDSKAVTTVNQTITDTRTDDLTATVEHGQTDTETVNLEHDTTYGRIDTENLDITDTTNYNNVDKEDISLTHANNGTEDSTGKEEHTLHRHGNIGVTTNQQMINEELALRKNFFYEIVMRDIDRFLTLSVY